MGVCVRACRGLFEARNGDLAAAAKMFQEGYQADPTHAPLLHVRHELWMG